MCGTPLQGRQTSACSGKCRAAKSRRRRVPVLVAEAHAVRMRLRAAREALAEAETRLEKRGEG